MPDKRDIHQAKSKGRHKPGGGSSAAGQAGSRRGAAMVTGPDTAAAIVGGDRSAKQGNAPSAGGGRDRERNRRT
jgi:hypothetical protein